MFGPRGGFAAAFVASAGFFAWALAEDGLDVYDAANHRHLISFALGLLTGYYAHGLNLTAPARRASRTSDLAGPGRPGLRHGPGIRDQPTDALGPVAKWLAENPVAAN